MVDHPKPCPTCGAIRPLPLLFYRQPEKQAIYDFLCRRPDGATRAEIIDFVYQDDPNGGPESASIISAHIAQMRPKLHSVGVDILGSRRIGGYKIVKVP